MDGNLVEQLKSRAHLLAGKFPREREKGDPIIASSVNKAVRFVSRILPELGAPLITGGTTSNPDRILTLYWLVPNAPKILGVYVNFFYSDECAVDNLDLETDKHFTNLTLDELFKFDVASKFHEIEDHVRLQRLNGGWPRIMH